MFDTEIRINRIQGMETIEFESFLENNGGWNKGGASKGEKGDHVGICCM